MAQNETERSNSRQQIRRSQSDKRSLRFKTSQTQEIQNSQSTNKIRRSLQKKIKTQQNINEPIEQAQTRGHFSSPTSEQNRFLENHHNTNSLAQLLHKNESTLKISELKEQSARNTIKKQSQVKISISDYESEEQEKNHKKSKKSSNFSSSDDLSSSVYGIYGYKTEVQKVQLPLSKEKKQYKPYCLKENELVKGNESEKRMQQRYWKIQDRVNQEIKQIKEINAFMKSYKKSKQQMIQQSTKKRQIQRMVWAFQNRSSQRVHSLPKLDTIAQDQLLQNKQKNKKQVFKTKQSEKKSLQSLSMGKYERDLKKKTKNQYCTSGIHNEQQEKNISHIMKRKGVNWEESKKTCKKMIKMNTLPDENLLSLPRKDLLSNPIYKKYPL